MTDSRDQQFFNALNTTRADDNDGPSGADTGPLPILSAGSPPPFDDFAAAGRSADEQAAPDDDLDEHRDSTPSQAEGQQRNSLEQDGFQHRTWGAPADGEEAEDDASSPPAVAPSPSSFRPQGFPLPPFPPPNPGQDQRLGDSIAAQPIAGPPAEVDDVQAGRHHADGADEHDGDTTDDRQDIHDNRVEGYDPEPGNRESGVQGTGMFDARNNALQQFGSAPQLFSPSTPQRFEQPQRPESSRLMPDMRRDAVHRPSPEQSTTARGASTGRPETERGGTPTPPSSIPDSAPDSAAEPVDEPTRFIPREVIERIAQQRRRAPLPPPPGGWSPQSNSVMPPPAAVHDSWTQRGGEAGGRPRPQQPAGAPDYGPTPSSEPASNLSGPRPPAWDWGSTSGGGEVRSEQISASELVAPRKIVPSRGWRKWLYYGTFKLINPGESPDEQLLRNLNETVAGNLRGTYSVVVLGGKGGVGKTTTTAAVGSIFASLRNDKTVAIDANPDRASNLADRIDPSATSSYKEVLADQDLIRYSDIRAHVGQNKPAGLDVLGNRYQADRPPLTAQIYIDTHSRLERFYSVLISDSGTDVDHPVIPGLMNQSDALIMVASTATDGAKGAAELMDWAYEANYHGLLQRTVVVINDVRGEQSKSKRKLVESLVEKFSRWVGPQRVFVVPFDPHIASGDVIDIKQLRPETERRFLEIAAKVASGFNSSEDRR